MLILLPTSHIETSRIVCHFHFLLSLYTPMMLRSLQLSEKGFVYSFSLFLSPWCVFIYGTVNVGVTLVEVRGQPWMLVLAFLLIWDSSPFWCLFQAGWLESLQGFSCICFPLWTRGTVVTFRHELPCLWALCKILNAILMLLWLLYPLTWILSNS